MHPHSGQLIAGKYRLDTLVGEGAMGTVWAATDTNLGRRVAIKLILPELTDSESIRHRFESEARAAAALRSRFVVQVFDSGVEGDAPYLVMEYLEGDSLASLIARSGPLSLEYGVQLIAQLAKGLARAHEQGIIHRDLKPANVFLAHTEDGDEVAKILDFGIAKFLKDAPSVSATATGAVVGTPLFMSPEQARGKKSIDHRADLFSLGALAFYAWVGDHAYRAEALGELILSVCTEPLPSIVARRPDLPPRIDDWYHKACARDPDDRYQSSEDLVEGLLEATELDVSLLREVGVVTQHAQSSSRFALRSFAGARLPNTNDLFESPRLSRSSATASAKTVLATATQVGLTRASPSASPRRGPVIAVVGAISVVAVGLLIAAIASSTRVVADPEGTVSASVASHSPGLPHGAAPPLTDAPALPPEVTPIEDGAEKEPNTESSSDVAPRVVPSPPAVRGRSGTPSANTSAVPPKSSVGVPVDSPQSPLDEEEPDFDIGF